VRRPVGVGDLDAHDPRGGAGADLSVDEGAAAGRGGQLAELFDGQVGEARNAFDPDSGCPQRDDVIVGWASVGERLPAPVARSRFALLDAAVLAAVQS